jgi:RimJ/RimL family protein N-acetyltransferase
MTVKIPGPAYQIETDRLVLRCWNPSDAPLLETAVNESLDHLHPWMPWAKEEPTDLQTRIDLLRSFRANFDLGKEFIYGVFDPAETTVLGGSGLHRELEGSAREIGYWIHKDHTNRGFATELSAALTRVAFEVDGVDRVEIHMDPKNLRSAAVPRKLGFIHEATLRRRAATTEGRPRDTMIWTLFAHDYPDSPAAGAQLSAFDVVGRRIL